MTDRIAPVVGMGCTICWLTDRKAGTITAVSPSLRKITVQEDRAIRTDNNGMSGPQTYRYERDTGGAFHVFYFQPSDQTYRTGGKGLRLGERSSYHDYSF